MFLERIYVINLDRSKDRWKKIKEYLNKEKLEYKRFSGIDGQKLDYKTIKKHTSFISRNFKCNRGMIGASLSHYFLWKKLVKEVEENYKNPKDQNNQWMLIFEDDAEPVDNYKSKILALEKEVLELNKKGHQIELLNLNCAGDCHEENRNIFNSVCHNLIPTLPLYTKGKKSQSISLNISKSGFSVLFQNYLISYQGAKKLTEFIEKEKIHNHPDVMANKITIHSSKLPLVKHQGYNDSTIQTFSYPCLLPIIIKWTQSESLGIINWYFSVIAFSLFLNYSINHYFYIYFLIILILIFFNKKTYLMIFLCWILLDLSIYFIQ